MVNKKFGTIKFQEIVDSNRKVVLYLIQFLKYRDWCSSTNLPHYAQSALRAMYPLCTKLVDNLKFLPKINCTLYFATFAIFRQKCGIPLFDVFVFLYLHIRVYLQTSGNFIKSRYPNSLYAGHLFVNEWKKNFL